MHDETAVYPALPTTRPWYAQRWPWLLMIGPIAVVLAGSYTGWLAYSQQDALVVGDYYKQGQAINQDLRRDRAATALGLSLTLRFDPAVSRLGGRLLSRGEPLAGAMRIRLVHSTRPEQDLSLDAHADQDGIFSVVLPMLDQARWQVQVENAARDWRLEGAWKWPQQKDIAIAAEPAR